MSSRGLLLGRHLGRVPVDLLRVQGTKVARLRLEIVAKEAGRSSYDISAHSDGLVHPRHPSEARYLGPNGMSMRPKGGMMAVIIAGFKGKCTVYCVPAGTPIPPELVILHEHTDHYSVQPAVSMQPKHLDNALQAFLDQPGVKKYASKEVFYAAHPDMTPERVGFSENA